MKNQKKNTMPSCIPGKHGIGREIIVWFRKNQRSLPWRGDYTPYKVWISEMMLQQTQVDRVIPYFERWMKDFPDPASVAEAEEDVLLRSWEGLGYYSRVRNLQKAAQKIVREHDGKIPNDEKALRTLPGIGPYTAAAILSLAFNEDIPVLDANVERVVARIVDMGTPVKTMNSRKAIQEYLSSWLPTGHACEFNQAVMELGAILCTPLRPTCETCPVRLSCEALRNGTISQRPVLDRPMRSVPLISVVGILVEESKVFIQKRPSTGLMASLWEFPGGKVKGTESPEECLQRALLEELGVNGRIVKKVADFRHSYTRFRVHFHAYIFKLEPPGQKMVLRSAVEGQWVSTDELDSFAFPSAGRRLAEILRKKNIRDL